MTDIRLSRDEQETIIRGSAASREWEVCTADPKMIRRMHRQGYIPEARPNPWGYVSFTVPFNRIAIRKAEKRKVTGKPFSGHANSHASENHLSISIVG